LAAFLLGCCHYKTEIMTIDNVSYDEKAMAQLTQDEFVNTHLDNDAIYPLISEKERVFRLKDAYSLIKKATDERAAIKGKDIEPKDSGAGK
jgi:hypothetical protein